MQSHRAGDRMGAQGYGKDLRGFVLQCINPRREGKRWVREAGWEKIEEVYYYTSFKYCGG